MNFTNIHILINVFYNLTGQNFINNEKSRDTQQQQLGFLNLIKQENNNNYWIGNQKSKQTNKRQMQIVINSKCNQKLLQHYPDDPYSNITIVTQTRKLHLQLAYLSIDSGYFSRIDPDTQQITLAHLPQQPLLRILRSLYGQQLIAYSINQLSQLYKIITQLQIQQYIENIKQQITTKTNILQSLQFLQFSFTQDILKQEVIDKHIDNQLKFLQSNRNYLQLNKISLNTFQTLLLSFIQVMIKKYINIDTLLAKPQAQVINHVMENYFNRNNIKPLNYFKQTLQNKNSHYLEIIWNKYHHTFLFNNPNTLNQPPVRTFQISMTNLPTAETPQTKFLSVKNLQQMPRKKSQQIVHIALSPSQSSKQSQLQMKKQKLQQLQTKIKQRDQTITELQIQIQTLKNSQSKNLTKPKKRASIDYRSAHIIPKTIHQEQSIKQTNSEQSMNSLPYIKTTKKSKQYEDDEDFNVSGVFEPSFNSFRKLPELKEVRTMKKAADLKTKFQTN